MLEYLLALVTIVVVLSYTDDFGITLYERMCVALITTAIGWSIVFCFLWSKITEWWNKPS